MVMHLIYNVSYYECDRSEIYSQIAFTRTPKLRYSYIRISA